MTNETTTSPLRFVHISRGAGLLAHPLPSRLEGNLTAKQRKEHAALAERVEVAGREIARLRREIDGAAAADHAAARDAALRGEELPPPSEERLRREFEEAQRVREALDAALRASADALLQAAAPKAGEVAAELEQEQDALVEDVRARLVDVGEALRELADLTAQAAWARGIAGASGQTVSPFRPSASFGETLQKLVVVGQAFDFELGNLAERRRAAELQRVDQAGSRADTAAERERRARVAEQDAVGGEVKG